MAWEPQIEDTRPGKLTVHYGNWVSYIVFLIKPIKNVDFLWRSVSLLEGFISHEATPLHHPVVMDDHDFVLKPMMTWESPILRNFQVILGNWAGESSPHAWLKIMTQDFQVAECDVSRMIK